MCNDSFYMRRAAKLANKAFGRTSPNPLVGAVIVKDGEIVGSGWHKKAGTHHAEVNAISDAGKKCEGATIYVTLEPCSTFGRTPPCTEAIKSAKIAKVVIGSIDPNPKHAGNGVEILKKSGIKVVTGIEKERCDALNEAFFFWIRTGRPFVILKMGMTLDGKTATESGVSKWITGPESRRDVTRLRKWADAIMVGGETVRLDSPSLTVRNSQNKPLRNWPQPKRFIASHTMTQREAEILMGDGPTPEIVSADTPEEWKKVLQRMGSQNITSLLVEGGSELAASLLKAEVVNKIVFYIAPKILGGKTSRPVIGGNSPETLSEAINLEDVTYRKFGSDLRITGTPLY